MTDILDSDVLSPSPAGIPHRIGLHHHDVLFPTISTRINIRLAAHGDLTPSLLVTLSSFKIIQVTDRRTRSTRDSEYDSRSPGPPNLTDPDRVRSFKFRVTGITVLQHWCIRIHRWPHDHPVTQTGSVTRIISGDPSRRLKLSRLKPSETPRAGDPSASWMSLHVSVSQCQCRASVRNSFRTWPRAGSP